MKNIALHIRLALSQLFFLIAYLIPAMLCAQAPSTEIYLTAVSNEEQMLTLIGQMKNISNHQGYDNQPSFSPDGNSIYFTSVRDSLQSDIYRYDIEGDSLQQITYTAESEYSPTVMPDESHFSVVRVEKDSTQRLWKFALDGSSPELILKTIKPVGYHCWLDENWVALFVLGNTNLLMLADIVTEKANTIANNIGRSLHIVPGENGMSYVEKENDSTWFIKAFNFDLKATRTIIQTLPGSEDYAFLHDGTVLMAKGSTLYKFHSDMDTGWVEIADFASDGLTSITRIAVSPDETKIALVSLDKK